MFKRTISIFRIPIALSVFMAVAATGALAQQAPDSEGSGITGPAETKESGTGIYQRMPPRPDIPRPDKHKVPFRVPDDPDFQPSMLPPSDPPVESPDDNGTIEGEEFDNVGKSDAAAAPGDYVAFRNSNLDPNSGPGITGASTVDEPSVGVNGRVVFYTGNWFAAFSGDGGQTFQYVDPYDNFPADGTNDIPTNSGRFCCDQVVHFEPTRGLMVWFLQYNKSGENPASDSNVFRIAIANSQADVLNNNWFWWTFSPDDFGLPANGVWFDYPDLSYTNEHLYMTTNVFNIVAPTPGVPNSGGDTYNTSLIIRFPLDELADGGNTSFHYWNRSGSTLRPVQNATTRMYLARHEDSNTIRVYWVYDNSTTLNFEDIDHSGYNRLVDPNSTTDDVFNAPGPDGTDFAERGDSRILGAWRSASSSEIGFMWNADESDGTGDVSSGYPFPYTRIIRVRTSDWSVRQERSIWATGYAWLYPSVNVNDRGHLGGTIANGGGSRNPRSYAWIIDDYNSPVFPSLDDFEVHRFATSDDGPNDDQWGDYLTTRRMVPYGNTWVGTGFRMGAGGEDADTVPEFIWFGRERDMPPSTNTIYVDYQNTSGYEIGTSANPFNTAEEGEVALQPGDDLLIRTGTYEEEFIFDTQSDVNNLNGTSIIVGGGPTANPEARLRAEEPPAAAPAAEEDVDAETEETSSDQSSPSSEN